MSVLRLKHSHNPSLKRVRHEVADVLLISFLIMRNGSLTCRVADSFLFRHASPVTAGVRARRTM